MSVEAITWAKKARAGCVGAKCVLFILADYADEDGLCWPTQETIARQTEESVDSVARHLKQLEVRGIIQRRGREVRGGGRPVTVYQLLLSEFLVAGEKNSKLTPHGAAPQFAAPQTNPAPCGVESTTRTVKEVGGGARKSGEKISILPEAISLAEEIAAIAGLADPKAWPPDWCGTATIVDAWLREGYTADDLRTGAQMAMASKRDGPPRSAKYFKWAWPKARGMRESPVPAADQTTNVRRTNIRDKWRERTENAFAELQAYIDANADDKAGSGRPGEESAERLSLAKPP